MSKSRVVGAKFWWPSLHLRKILHICWVFVRKWCIWNFPFPCTLIAEVQYFAVSICCRLFPNSDSLNANSCGHNEDGEHSIVLIETFVWHATCSILKRLKLKYLFACHEEMWESGGIAPLIVNLGTRWKLMVWALSPSPLTYEERAPSTHWVEGCMGPWACLDVCP
jgi:hypothetical protein